MSRDHGTVTHNCQNTTSHLRECEYVTYRVTRFDTPPPQPTWFPLCENSIIDGDERTEDFLIELDQPEVDQCPHWLRKSILST
ncbi:hypothetical protein J6590_052799 [Homalodisca vitripennis]|nr:hypothetical protein J6590_052799 [Homalodisca vitripennis]